MDIVEDLFEKFHLTGDVDVHLVGNVGCLHEARTETNVGVMSFSKWFDCGRGFPFGVLQILMEYDASPRTISFSTSSNFLNKIFANILVLLTLIHVGHSQTLCCNIVRNHCRRHLFSKEVNSWLREWAELTHFESKRFTCYCIIIPYFRQSHGFGYQSSKKLISPFFRHETITSAITFMWHSGWICGGTTCLGVSPEHVLGHARLCPSTSIARNIWFLQQPFWWLGHCSGLL